MQTNIRTLRIALTFIAISATILNVHSASNIPTWQRVTIPGLLGDSTVRSIWTRNACEAYAWIGRAVGTNTTMTLYRHDGAAWTPVLQTNGSRVAYYCAVHGTGTDTVIAAYDRLVWVSSDRGVTWQQQANLAVPADYGIRQIAGTANDVHALFHGGLDNRQPPDGQIWRFNGSAWGKVYDTAGISDPAGYRPYALTFARPGEGYWLSCWGSGYWNGTAWTTRNHGYDFCDISSTWATRGPGGELGWWGAGNNNFANGVRVWCYNTNTMSFGGKFGYCFADGDGAFIGEATGVWGSGLNDVYVVGRVSTGSPAGLSGRVYHYDGGAWSRVSAVGNIPECNVINGSASDNVWVGLTDGSFLHYAVAPPGGWIASTFSTGAEGWTANSGGTLRHVTDGGNPGGYLQVEDSAGDPDHGIYAPERFLGNLMAFNRGALSFDWKVVSYVPGACIDTFQPITMTGPAGAATWSIQMPVPPFAWTRVTVPLTAVAWGKTETQWCELLANVTNIFVELEIFCNSDTLGFDNFTLTPAVPPARIRVSEVEICWDSSSNVVYQVDYRSSLTTNTWQPLQTNITGTGGTMCIYDKIPRGEPQRFYQIGTPMD